MAGAQGNDYASGIIGNDILIQGNVDANLNTVDFEVTVHNTTELSAADFFL